MTRFADLKKIPAEPAARMLSTANLKLQTEIKAPASASVPEVLTELDEAGAIFDELLLLAVALPKREATWWGCLAARDLVGQDVDPVPASLGAAEAWVFKPTDENREAARAAMEVADIDDDTSLCAMAAFYGDGTLGPGELAEHPAPPAAVAAAVFGINMKSLDANSDRMQEHATLLIDRALNIARGGNGSVAAGGES